MKKQKIVLGFLLLLLLFCAWPATGMAAPPQYLIYENEMQQLLKDSQRSKEINRVLQLNTTETQKLLLTSLEEISSLKKQLTESKEIQQQLLDENEKMKSLSMKQEKLIDDVNNSFKQYSKEVKKEINSLKTKNTLLTIGAGILITTVVIQSIKK